MSAKFTSTFTVDRAALEAALYGPATESAITGLAEKVAEIAQRKVVSGTAGTRFANEGLDAAELTQVRPIQFWSSRAAGREIRRVAKGGGPAVVPVALVVSDSINAQAFEFGAGFRPLVAPMRTAVLAAGGRWVPLTEEAS